MVRVAPFHSKEPATTVYHDDDACPEAAKLRISDCDGGTGGLPRCEECANLEAWRRVARRREEN